MVANIVDAFRKRVDALEWMAPSTRKEALAKLDVLYVGVGYPDKWTSYEGLEIKPDDAMGNALRAEKFHYRQQLAKLGKKVDSKEWCMPPHIVNAVNMPMQNALNFPAAILQPPFFDMKASDAHNYGAIGSVIGHEISHSFDDTGAQFDSKGRLRDWWTKEDGEHFKQAAAKLVAQYDAYEAFPDLKLNGTLTLPGPGRQRPADPEREPGRPGRPGSRAGCLPCLAGRQGHADAGPRILQRLCLQLGQQGARRLAAQPGHDRRPLAGQVAHLHRAQPGQLVPGLRREAGPEAVPGAGPARTRLVK
jgi:hypothetical protein